MAGMLLRKVIVAVIGGQKISLRPKPKILDLNTKEEEKNMFFKNIQKGS